MRLINVLKAFTLRLVHEGESIERRVAAGVQEVEDYIADHWYTKAHTGPLPDGVAAAPANPSGENPPKSDAGTESTADSATAKASKK